MMVNKYILIAITLIITFITNFILKMSFLLGGIVTVAIVTLAYILYINYKQGKRYKILEENLDPEGFIEATHEAYRYAGKNKQLNSLLNMDLAFAHMSLGEYKETKEFLQKVEPNHLPRLNKSILAYYNTLMMVHYNLKEEDRAHEVYSQAKEYEVKDKLARDLMTILQANRYFYEADYEASRKEFDKYPKDKISKRLELEILFVLARIDEEEGKMEEARPKYERVAKEGNKLYSAKLAREKLGL